MPIHLKAPTHKPGGPDGKGWNRLSLNAHMGRATDRCAMRPRTYGALWESRRNTQHAEWGGFYAACTNSGACDTCPLLTTKAPTLNAFTDRVLVRILDRRPVETDDFIPGGRPAELHLMNHPDKGWASSSYQWTWEDIRRLAGWEVGPRHADEHGDGFWLVKVNADASDGLPSPCAHEYLNWRHCADCRRVLD